jgi:hypothetical protein
VLLLAGLIAWWGIWVTLRTEERNEATKKRAERKMKAAAYRRFARHRRPGGSA